MNSESKQFQGPRLVKAADLAARRDQEAIKEIEAKARKQKVESIAKVAARLRTPRDARAVFDSLFGKPAA